MNCNMMMIGKARQDMFRQATKEETQKEKIEAWKKYRDEVRALSEVEEDEINAIDPKDFTVPTLKSLILFKQGPYPEEPNNEKITISKGKLMKLWGEKYCERLDPVVEDWTEADNKNLERLQAGDVGCLENTDLYKRSFMREQECLTTRLATLPLKRSKNVLLHFFQGLAPDVQKQLFAIHARFDSKW